MGKFIQIFADLSLSSCILSSFICFLMSYIYCVRKDSAEFYLTITLASSAFNALLTYLILNSFLWDSISSQVLLAYHSSIALSALTYVKTREAQIEWTDSILRVCRTVFSVILSILLVSYFLESMVGINPVFYSKDFISKSILLGNVHFNTSPTILGEILAIVFLLNVYLCTLRILQLNHSSKAKYLMNFGILLSLAIITNNTVTIFPEYQYCLPLGFASFLFEAIRISVEVKKKSFEKLQKNKADISYLSQASILGLATRQTVHELRNPLFTAKMAVERIEKKDSSEVSRILHRSVSEMENIVEDILLSKINHKGLKRTEENIIQVINDAIASITTRIDRNNIRLKFRTDISRQRVKIVKSSITLALVNVILNAVEATENSTIEEGHFIDISVEEIGSYFQIEVVDSGFGVEKDNIDKIFLENFSTGKKISSGLGLSFARSQLEGCGGSITLDVNRNLTTFIIRLPIHCED